MSEAKWFILRRLHEDSTAIQAIKRGYCLSVIIGLNRMWLKVLLHFHLELKNFQLSSKFKTQSWMFSSGGCWKEIWEMGVLEIRTEGGTEGVCTEWWAENGWDFPLMCENSLKSVIWPTVGVGGFDSQWAAVQCECFPAAVLDIISDSTETYPQPNTGRLEWNVSVALQTSVCLYVQFPFI